MGKDPSMPFYVNDWLSSAKVTCMSLEQQGAFMRLLAHCWASQDASIPDDDEELAALSGMGQGWLNGGSRLVRRCFIAHPHKPGYLTNEKTLQLWEERQEWREKSREGGLKSAAKRQLQNQNGGSTTVATKRQPKGNSSSSSSSSSKWSTDDRRVDHRCELTGEEIATVRRRANDVANKIGKRAEKPEDRSLVLKAAILSLRAPFTEHWLYDAAEGVRRAAGRKQTHYGYFHTCLANGAKAIGQVFNTALRRTTIPPELFEPPPPEESLNERLCNNAPL